MCTSVVLGRRERRKEARARARAAKKVAAQELARRRDIRARMRAYAARQQTPSACKARTRNRAKNLLRRTARRRDTPTPATIAERLALVAPGAPCLYCGAQAQHVDHFWPIARWQEALPHMTEQERANGPDHIGNLVGACATCNCSKNAWLPDIEWQGRGTAPGCIVRGSGQDSRRSPGNSPT